MGFIIMITLRFLLTYHFLTTLEMAQCPNLLYSIYPKLWVFNVLEKLSKLEQLHMIKSVKRQPKKHFN